MPSASYLNREIRKFEQTASRSAGDKKIVLLYSRRLKHLARFIRPSAKILDIGSGNGIFLLVTRHAGYKIDAMDKSTYCARYAKHLGFTSYTDLEQIPSRTYDAITLFDVIEHIPDLQVFIRKIRSKLKQNGVLMITTPNNQGITAHFVPSYLTAGDGIYSGHVVLYATVTLRCLLRHGFTPLETKTDILLQWYHSNHRLRDKILNKCVYLLFMPFLPFLFSHMLGDNIQMIVKKKIKE